jgi:hypothetical protein
LVCDWCSQVYRGAIVDIMGERHVICIECGILGLAASNRTEGCCQACWTGSQGFGYSRQYLARRREGLARESEMREQWARERAARAAHHKRMKDTWGSDYELVVVTMIITAN